MPALEWLTARPIAHRGLHDAPSGAIENTATAFSAAIAGGYGMETDLQISADGEAMVHHDDALGRLTEGSGRLAEMTAADIKAVRFKASAARILTLGELCDLVAGRRYSDSEWDSLSIAQRRSLTWLLHAPKSRPQFLAYSVKDLPAAPPLLARTFFGLPLLTWTVRTEDDRNLATRWADQIIFEGWRP